MSLVPIDEITRDRFGPARPNQELWIYERDTTNEVALFADQAGLIALSQPLLSDNEGRYTRDSAGHQFTVVWGQSALYDKHLPGDALNPTVPLIVPGTSLRVFNVLDYGADPTGTRDSQPAIQKALDLCMAAGGGTAYVPAGTYLLTALAYNAGGLSAHLCAHDDRVRLLGEGWGTTTLISTTTGHCLMADWMGYVKDDGDPNNWAINRFTDPSVPFYAFDPATVIEQGQLVIPLPGGADVEIGDAIFMATGQWNAVGTRNSVPDAFMAEVVDVGVSTFTLKRGAPKPMRQQYYPDGSATNYPTTFAVTAFPARFGFYNLRGRAIRKGSIKGMTLISAGTIGEAVTWRAIFDFELDVELLSHPDTGGLATFVAQEFDGAHVHVSADNWNPDGLGYYGFACGSSRARGQVEHTNRTDVAAAFFNEGVADMKLDLIQRSAKDAPSGITAFGVGQSYDFHADVVIENGPPNSAVGIQEGYPEPYYSGRGKLRLTLRGDVPVPGYCRGNWDLESADALLLASYGPADPGAVPGTVPKNNATKSTAPSVRATGRLVHGQDGGRLHLCRIPRGSYFDLEFDVKVAFTAGTQVDASVIRVDTLAETTGALGFRIPVDTTGRKIIAAADEGVQNAGFEQDVFLEFHGGATPAAGELVALATMTAAVRGV